MSDLNNHDNHYLSVNNTENPTEDINGSLQTTDADFLSKEGCSEDAKLINQKSHLDPEVQKFKRFVWKNVITLSLTFMMNYISYYGLFNLQSSLHQSQGLGTTCTSIRFIVFAVSSLFLTNIMVRFLGHKWTMTLSLFSFIIWVVANGFGTWSVMAPASVFNGIFDAPLWISQGSYLSELGKQYAEKTQQKPDKITTLFFSVFGAIHCLATVFGSVISTAILKQSPPDNYTGPGNEEIKQCGMNHCPWQHSNNTNFVKPQSHLVWRLVMVYTGFTALAIIMSMLFVDSIVKPAPPSYSSVAKQTTPTMKLKFLSCHGNKN